MKQLKVDAINNGTVIDHIPTGMALKVLSVLQTSPTDIITVGVNFTSTDFTKKDILKIEGRELSQDEVNRIAIIAPTATLNIIRDFEVITKGVVKLPDVLDHLFDCHNPVCVTINEGIKTKYIVESKEPVKLRCYYCERVFEGNEIKI